MDIRIQIAMLLCSFTMEQTNTKLDHVLTSQLSPFNVLSACIGETLTWYTYTPTR